MDRVGVVGAGSWGTALADLLASNGYTVDLWVYEDEVRRQIETFRENRTFLPGTLLHDGVVPTCDMEAVVRGKSLVVLVVPSHVYRSVVNQMLPYLDSPKGIVSATKGIENDTLCLMSDILEELLPDRLHGHVAFLSGPSFAREVARKLPAAVTVASHSSSVCALAQRVFSNSSFRVYTSNDVRGVELGGAVKNVIAIAAGACEGLDLGSNAMAALITRGLAEMSRLGLAMGANPLTFAGLAGVGDLVLTCTGSLSRNRNVGYQMGRGRTLADILKDMVMVAEGVKTSKAVHHLARREGVELPICEQVYRILYEDASPTEAVRELMGRELKSELAGIHMGSFGF